MCHNCCGALWLYAHVLHPVNRISAIIVCQMHLRTRQKIGLSVGVFGVWVVVCCVCGGVRCLSECAPWVVRLVNRVILMVFNLFILAKYMPPPFPKGVRLHRAGGRMIASSRGQNQGWRASAREFFWDLFYSSEVPQHASVPLSHHSWCPLRAFTPPSGGNFGPSGWLLTPPPTFFV